MLGLLPHFLDWGSQPTAGLLRQRVPTRGCCCHSLSHSVLPFAFGRPGSVVHPHFCLLLYGIWWESTTFQQHFGCERKRTDLSLLLSLLSVSPHAPHGPRGREAVLGSRLVVKSLILSEDVFPMTWPAHGSCKCLTPGIYRRCEIDRSVQGTQPPTAENSRVVLEGSIWLGVDLFSLINHLPAPAHPAPLASLKSLWHDCISSAVCFCCCCCCFSVFQREDSLVSPALSLL